MTHKTMFNKGSRTETLVRISIAHPAGFDLRHLFENRDFKATAPSAARNYLRTALDLGVIDVTCDGAPVTDIARKVDLATLTMHPTKRGREQLALLHPKAKDAAPLAPRTQRSRPSGTTNPLTSHPPAMRLGAEDFRRCPSLGI